MENRIYPLLDDFSIRLCPIFIAFLCLWGNIFVVTKENSHSKTDL